MRLEISRFIEGDLDEVAGYIAQDNPRRAVTFIQEIRAKFLNVRRNPLLYQLRPDIGDDARMATIGNYANLFRVIDEGGSAHRARDIRWPRPSGHVRSALIDKNGTRHS
jgi:toxin ParE1/3/4